MPASRSETPAASKIRSAVSWIVAMPLSPENMAIRFGSATRK